MWLLIYKLDLDATIRNKRHGDNRATRVPARPYKIHFEFVALKTMSNPFAYSTHIFNIRRIALAEGANNTMSSA